MGDRDAGNRCRSSWLHCQHAEQFCCGERIENLCLSSTVPDPVPAKQLPRNTVSGDDYVRRQSTSSGHFNMYAALMHAFGNLALAVACPACPQYPCAQSLVQWQPGFPRIGTEGRMKDASHPDGTIAQNKFATVTKPVIIYGSGGAVTSISAQRKRVFRYATENAAGKGKLAFSGELSAGCSGINKQLSCEESISIGCTYAETLTYLYSN